MEAMDAVVPEKDAGHEVVYEEPTVEVTYDEPVIEETDDDITMTTTRRKTIRTKYRIQEMKILACLCNSSLEIVLIRNYSLKIFDTRHNRTETTVLSLIGSENSEVQHYTRKVKYEMDRLLPKLNPAKIFLIAELSLQSLKNSLYKLKYSTWWNVYGFFLIQNIYTPNSCNRAYDYLNMMWSFNILLATVVCLDKESNPQLYTFNPYSDIGPRTWRKVGQIKQSNGHPFTLFTQVFKDSALTCQNIIFDKTTILTGYPINIRVSYTHAVNNIKDKNILQGLSGFIHREIWTKLKVMLNVELVRDDLFVNFSGSADPLKMFDLLDSNFHMSHIMVYQEGYWKNELLTYIETGICYIANRELVTIAQEVKHAFFNNIVEIIIFLTTTTCIAICSRKISFIELILEALRAITSSQILWKPKKLLTRIIFIVFVILSMLINFQMGTELNSLMTVARKKVIQIKTAADLVNLNYQVHAIKYIREIISVTELGNRTHNVNSYLECMERMKSNKKIICATDCEYIKLEQKRITSNLHVSKDLLLRKNYALLLPNDYPLFPRIFGIYLRLYQHGFISYFNKLLLFKNKISHENTFSVIVLDDMKLFFLALAIIHTIACFVFIIERLVFFVIKIRKYKQQNSEL